MEKSIQHTIKRKGFSSVAFTSQYQQSNLHNIQKIKDRLDECSDSNGETGPSFDLEDLEYTQFFMSTIYLMVSSLMLVKILLMMKVMNLLRKYGTIKITIHPL